MAATGVTQAKSELEGTWLACEATGAGKPVSTIVGHRLSFRGDRFQIVMDDELLYGGTFRTDPAAKPRTIEFEQTETGTLAGVWLGLYELEGDTLASCDNARDITLPRPVRLSDCEMPGYILIRFTRQRRLPDHSPPRRPSS